MDSVDGTLFLATHKNFTGCLSLTFCWDVGQDACDTRVYTARFEQCGAWSAWCLHSPSATQRLPRIVDETLRFQNLTCGILDATQNEPKGVIGDDTTIGLVHDVLVSAQHGRYGIEVKPSMDLSSAGALIVMQRRS